MKQDKQQEDMLNLLVGKNAKNKLLYKHCCGVTVNSQHDYNLGLTNLLLDQ